MPTKCENCAALESKIREWELELEARLQASTDRRLELEDSKLQVQTQAASILEFEASSPACELKERLLALFPIRVGGGKVM